MKRLVALALLCSLLVASGASAHGLMHYQLRSGWVYKARCTWSGGTLGAPTLDWPDLLTVGGHALPLVSERPNLWIYRRGATRVEISITEVGWRNFSTHGPRRVTYHNPCFQGEPPVPMP